MTCERCREAVTTAIAAVDGVETVTVDLTSGRATVTAARPVDRADIAPAIEAAGYRVLSWPPGAKSSHRSRRRTPDRTPHEGTPAVDLLYEELFRARQAELVRDAHLRRLARTAEARSPRRRRTR